MPTATSSAARRNAANSGSLGRAEFALPTLAGDRAFRELLAAEAIETIHSEEASLGDVFADVTGSRL